MTINYKSILSLILFLTYFSINGIVINPVYILASITFILYFLINPRVIVKKYTIVNILFIILITLPMFIGVYYQSQKYPYMGFSYLSTTLFLYSGLIGIVAYEVGRRTNISDRIRSYKTHNYIFISFLIVDLVLRMLFPDTSISGWYKYKDSFVHYDTNFTGLLICVYMCFCLFLKQQKIYDIGTFSFIILFVLLIFTFSRASIAAFIITYFIFKFSGRFFKLFSFIALSLTIFSIYYAVKLFINGFDFKVIDGSLNSKFVIINKAISIYDSLPLNLKLSGIGLANFPQYADIFAHNMAVTLVFEFGILGTLAFVCYLVYLAIKTQGNIFYILLPVVICGFSLFTAYFSFFFVYASLIYLESSYSYSSDRSSKKLDVDKKYRILIEDSSFS